MKEVKKEEENPRKLEEKEMKRDREIVAESKRKISRIPGGVLLIIFLPLFLNAEWSGGISLYNTFIDNMYLLESTRESGIITGIRPSLEYTGNTGFIYYGNFSSINLNMDNLFINNNLKVYKYIDLPGLGNNSNLYGGIYNSFPLDYETFRYTDFYLGDSLRVYFGNIRIITVGGVNSRKYDSREIIDLTESHLNIALYIPIPYAYLIPSVKSGLRMYEEEKLPFYQTSATLDFPLTASMSLKIFASHKRYLEPETEYSLPDSLIGDPFFEYESIESSEHFGINGSWLPNESLRISANLMLFLIDFLDGTGQDRTDEGLRAGISIIKRTGKNSSLYIQYQTRLNSSNVSDYDYNRNCIDLGLQLIY